MNHVSSPLDDTPPVSSLPPAPTTATPPSSSKGFQAFISYSHAGEQDLARSIQLALESLGRRLFSLRSMRVFRDKTNLNANPDLWASIQHALDASQTLILLSSPKAAKSIWIPREVKHFVSSRGKDRVCIALASGITPWHSPAAADGVLRLPECAVAEEVYHLLAQPSVTPLVVDFSGFVAMSHDERLSSIEFLRAVAQIAGFILNRPPDDLVNDHVARQRRVIRVAAAAVLLLLATSGTAAWAALREREARTEAISQRVRAEGAERRALEQRDSADAARVVAQQEQARAESAERSALAQRDSANAARAAAQREQARADSQRIRAEGAEMDAIRERDAARRQALANGSYALAEQDPTIALQMAEMASPELNSTAAVAILKAFNTGSWLYSHRIDGAWDADLSADGRRIAWLDGKGSLHLWDLSTGAQRRVAEPSTHVRFLPSGNLVAWSGWNGPGTLGRVALLDPHGAPLATHAWEFLDAIVCPTGEVMVPSFAGGRRIAVHVIDPRTGGTRTLNLPEGVEDPGVKSACLPGGGIVVAQSLPGLVAVADSRGRSTAIEIPYGYRAVDVDVSTSDARVAIYLAGAVRDVPDAIGWLTSNEAHTPGARLRILPLSMSPGSDSGGRLRFLPDGRVIAASTEGWTRLVDLRSGASTAIERRRAADEIGVAAAGDIFVLARRSGVGTVYSSAGIPVGQLRGVIHSDGLNIAVERLAFDATGQSLLSVARNDVRLWRRPPFSLMVPHDSTFRPFAALPVEALQVLRGFGGGAHSPFVICGGTADMLIDDVGQLSLCIQGGGRTEYLGASLVKGDIEIMGHGRVDHVGYRWIAEEADRIFVLSPELILGWLREERRRGRLWAPDQATVDVWAAGGPRRR